MELERLKIQDDPIQIEPAIIQILSAINYWTQTQGSILRPQSHPWVHPVGSHRLVKLEGDLVTSLERTGQGDISSFKGRITAGGGDGLDGRHRY